MECERCKSILYLLIKNQYGPGAGGIDLYFCPCCETRYEVAKIEGKHTIIKRLDD